MSTCLWFSKSSLWRWWLFSSKVSQRAWTQSKHQHVTSTWLSRAGDHEQLWTYPAFLHVKQAPPVTPTQKLLDRIAEDKSGQRFKSNQGFGFSLVFFLFTLMTHLLIISLCDDNFCRKDCSPTCLSSRNSLSPLPLNQRLGGRARSHLGNRKLNCSRGSEEVGGSCPHTVVSLSSSC